MKLISFFTLCCVSWLSAQSYHFKLQPPFPDAAVNRVATIWQSSDHLVWFGTDAGIYTYDGRKYTFLPRPDRQRITVTAIAEAPDGRIWAGYEDGRIQIFGARFYSEFFALDSMPGAAITSILFPDIDATMVTTYGKGIWQHQRNGWARIGDSSMSALSDIYKAVTDQQHKIWMATDNGAYRYTPNSSSSISLLDQSKGLPDEIVTYLTASVEGDIWFGMYDHGLARYLPDADRITGVITLESGTENVTGLCADTRGNIWFSTDRRLFRCGRDGIPKHIDIPEPGSNRIDCIYADHHSRLWMTSGKRVYCANTDIERLNPNIGGIQALAAGQDQIWIGTDHGLLAVDRNSGASQLYFEKEQINILSLYPDDNGVLWIGTFGQGLYLLHPRSNRTRRLTEADGISNSSILNIDGRGNKIWLATLGGITSVEWTRDPFQDLEVTRFSEKYSFPAGYVYDVHAAPDGRIWFGTDGKGLYYLQDDALHAMDIQAVDSVLLPEKDLETIYSITTGPDHEVWISTSGGHVVQVDPGGRIMGSQVSTQGTPHSLITGGRDEILLVTDGMIQALHRKNGYTVYNEGTGLSGFTPHINATAVDPDGSVWIAGTDQVYHYMPPPAGAVYQVRLHLESIFPGYPDREGVIRIKPDSNFLDLRFSGLWYEDPGAVQYRYQLEGHDPDWIYTREGRVVYSRLSPGTYTFRLESTHQSDFSDPSVFTCQVLVLPPLYLRWWFLTGLVLTAAGLLYLYIRGRIRRINTLHQLEREKTMLQLHAIQAQVNPHFLFNSFNTLSSIIEEDQVAAVDYLDQLSGFFRGVLMHRNAELIRLDEELEIVRQYTYILQKRYGDNLRIREDIRHTSGFIAPLSIQLLVENAIKHNTVSKEKPLTISIVIEGEEVIVSNPVQPKFQPSAESTGFGLSSLLTRYQYLTPRKVDIRQDAQTFMVRIPVIHSDTPI